MALAEAPIPASGPMSGPMSDEQRAWRELEVLARRLFAETVHGAENAGRAPGGSRRESQTLAVLSLVGHHIRQELEARMAPR